MLTIRGEVASNMKNLLITGGCGFIGSNFIQYLHRIEPSLRIHNVDSLTYAANENNLNALMHNSNYVFTKDDICDVELIDRILV